MPPGWTDFEGDASTPEEKRRQQAIEKFVEKSLSVVQGKDGIALIFLVGEKPPVIKVLFSKGAESQWTIGRGDGCDIPLNEPGISKIHAYLKYKKNNWTIEDNNSTNGVWMDGKNSPWWH